MTKFILTCEVSHNFLFFNRILLFDGNIWQKQNAMLINIHAAKCVGIDALPVTVEIDITTGIGIHLVGLADAAVKESLLRTITSLQSMGFRIPGRKIVINLAPADMHKKGSGYDVPIALGIIASSGQRELPLLEKYMIMGELGLDGSIRDIPGALPIVELAAKEGLKGCILPVDSALQAYEYSANVEVYGVATLEEVLRIVSAEGSCEDLLARNIAAVRHPFLSEETTSSIGDDVMDLSEIVGQEGAKRAIEIAAAGNHSVLLIGPPGSGKSSLAKALAGILPPMSFQESLQTSKVYSVSGKTLRTGGIVHRRPFRNPHYSISVPALIGGGSDNILPGEISLAHNGVLMIDEFCEAPKKVLEVLRAPMEDKKVTISRLKFKVEFPADFMLVAATNPCPCGYYGEGDRCGCSASRRLAYLSRLSGPLVDRLDVQVWMSAVDARRLVDRRPEESSAVVAQRVLRAREIQRLRFAGESDEKVFTNAGMNSRMIERYCPLSSECKELLEKLISSMGLSARACSRVMKIARTIADLAGEMDILPEHLSEAAGLRFLDKSGIFD